MRSQSYMTRALRSRDPRYARVLEKLGHKRPDDKPAAKAKPVAKPKPPEEPAAETAALRAEYERVVGKRPWMGWDASELRIRIADALADAQTAKPAPDAED
jgi:hypothetical protein